MKHVHNIKHHKATNNDTEWRGSLYIKTNLLVLAFDRWTGVKFAPEKGSQFLSWTKMGHIGASNHNTFNVALELSFPVRRRRPGSI